MNFKNLVAWYLGAATVESAHFKVIQIKKGLRIIRIHRERELKNVDGRSGMSYKCAGGGMGLTSFSLVALLQTLACNVGGHTHSRLTCHAEHSSTCTLFYKPGKSVFTVTECPNRFELTGSLFQNSK